MKQYNRAQQKRLDLISVDYHTNLESDDEAACATRKNKRRPLLVDRKNNGEGCHYPSGSSSANWSPEIQHQQSDAKERSCQHRISFEDSRVHGLGSGVKDAAKDMKDAA